MSVFGKPLSEYIRFQRVVLALILAVGLARFGLSLAGAPNDLVKWLSVSVVMLIGMVYYAVAVHTTGFGTYKHLLPLLFIQNLLAQAIIVLGIAIAILTGQDNVFSAPEFSGGRDGKNWGHAGAHLIVIIVASLIGWLVGSAILFVTKRVAPRRVTPPSPASEVRGG